MMERISQRTKDDCIICVVAMVMGPPYSYERVSQDSEKYAKTDGEVHGLPWWKKIGHIVAIDRLGVIDPQEHPAKYRSFVDFSEIFKIEGWGLYSQHFWPVRELTG